MIMLPPYPYRLYGKWLPKPGNEETTKSQSHRRARWLAPLLGYEQPSLCQVCRSRKLDFRPLLEEPPRFKCDLHPKCNVVEDTDLTDLEMKNAVHIKDFLLEEAKATMSQCSLCKLLVGCVKQTWLDGWLLNMRCLCILRPRYDRLGQDREGPKIMHCHQVWVEFQPIEGEILFDMIYPDEFRSAKNGRSAIPAAINLKLLRGWLHQCDRKHAHPAIPSTLGPRMQTIINRGLFRAINTSTGSVETLTSQSKFVALSYVWGPTADQSNYQPLSSRPISAYAPTIRDAAVIARSIGFNWIWVDRICIDQTSTSEKAILIPYMKDIYAAAQLTIVAGCGDGAQSGLLGSPATPREAEKPLALDSSVALLPVAQAFNLLLGDSVWYRRGWTFEEFVLSRRLLVVFNSEVFLTCGTRTFRESTGRRLVAKNKDTVYRGIFGERTRSFTADIHRSIQRYPANVSEVLDIEAFTVAVSEYTTRDLTIEEDRVAAFAGVVIAAVPNRMDEASERALLRHGHPLRFFEILLTWEHSGPGRQTSPIPNKPFAPSWSWASSPMRTGFALVRNRLIMDQSNFWFQYSFLQNHDILGLPTKNNLIGDLIRIKLPDELITDRPWMKSLSTDVLLPGNEARPSTSSHIYDTPLLPKFHLVTLVFDARFVQQEDEDKHVLVSLESTETENEISRRPGMRFFDLGEWSIHPELLSRYSAEGIGSRPQPFETFAVITGRMYYTPTRNNPSPGELYYDLYIMLLESTGQKDTYTRVGMDRRCGVQESHYLVDVIKKGRPRWQYIRII
ncbi:heterokaryon incompatibility protein-domain-containing protein [Nemania serpens]|nr:heterokaryon incompatibility protein-domain-containing protein [Nemania serpens]